MEENSITFPGLKIEFVNRGMTKFINTKIYFVLWMSGTINEYEWVFPYRYNKLTHPYLNLKEIYVFPSFSLSEREK